MANWRKTSNLHIRCEGDGEENGDVRMDQNKNTPLTKEANGQQENRLLAFKWILKSQMEKRYHTITESYVIIKYRYRGFMQMFGVAVSCFLTPADLNNKA